MNYLFRMKYSIAFLIVMKAGILFGQPPDLKKYFDGAQASLKEKDYESVYGYMVEAEKLHPYHQGVLYLKAKAASLTDRKEDAIESLKKAIAINASYPLS